jgi:hypothetical protein
MTPLLHQFEFAQASALAPGGQPLLDLVGLKLPLQQLRA